MFIDFHTHNPSREGEMVIQQDVHSVGIHPWNINEEKLEEDLLAFDKILSERKEKLLDNSVLAIGECGLDKLCKTPFDVQKEVFLHQVLASEKHQLPLIIHCVKAVDEMIGLKGILKPTQCWVLHGFRGKPQQAQQLLSKGFYLSFGFLYNKESLLSCPLDRLFLESDTDIRPVSLLYEKVSSDLSISVKKMKERISENYNLLFNKK